MDSNNTRQKIEAVLFTVGRPITIQRLAELTNIGSVGIVKQELQNLIQEYNKRDTAIEIVQDDDKYRMTIKPEFVLLVKSLMSSTELDKPTQETLAVIAWKQPMLQSDLVKVRGTSTYEHVQLLTEEGFITSEKSGRSRLIKLTPKFYEYFDTNKENIQSTLQEVRDKIKFPEIPQKQNNPKPLNEEGDSQE